MAGKRTYTSIYELKTLRETVDLLTKVAEVDPSIANKRRMTNAAIELYKVVMGFNDKEAEDSIGRLWGKSKED